MHEAPHVPFQGRDDPGYRFPDISFDYHGPVKDKERAYREMVEVMDEGIGKVMDVLAETGLLEKTFVFFLSDNGGLEGYGDNGSLRGAKTTLYEGGHRVPAIASWKGKINQGVSDDLILSFDLFPTILSICGVEKREDLLLDGMDISRVLFDQDKSGERNVFWRYRNQWSVRSGAMKLLMINGDTLLYNLVDDVTERHNLASDSIHLLQEMLKTLQDWDNEMNVYQQKTR
jgi:arylsulfatase A-like enzyme